MSPPEIYDLESHESDCKHSALAPVVVSRIDVPGRPKGFIFGESGAVTGFVCDECMAALVAWVMSKLPQSIN